MSELKFPSQILLDQLEQMVFVVDEYGAIVYANHAASTKTEWSNTHFLTKNLKELLSSTSDYIEANQSLEASNLFNIKCNNNALITCRLTKKEIRIKDGLYYMFQEENESVRENRASLNTVTSIIILNNQRIIIGFHAGAEIDSIFKSPLKIGKHIHDCFSKEMLVYVEKALSEAKKNGSSSAVNYRLITEKKPHDFQINAILNEAGDASTYNILLNNSELLFTGYKSLYDIIIDQGEEGIVLIDENCHIVLWNKGQEKITGLKSKETIGQYIWDVMYDLGTQRTKKVHGAREQLKKRYLKLIKNEATEWLDQTTETEIHSKSEETRIISSTLFKVELNNKKLIGAKHQDITEQKKAELSLMENEEYIRTLYYDSPIPVIVIDEKQKLIFDLNNAAVTAFGYTKRSELIGIKIESLFIANYKGSIKNTPNPLDFLTDKTISFIDCQLSTRNGSNWDANVYIFRLSTNEKDLIQLTLVDTTDNNNMVQALFESESRYRAVTDNANAGIIIVDLNENIEYANEAMAAMLGYSKEMLIGNSLLNFSPTDSFYLFTEKTKKRIQGLTDQYENVLLHKNGEHKTFSVSAAALRSLDNEIIGSVGVLLDITKQKTDSKKLFETSEQLHAILAAMPDMIYTLDEKGYISNYFNNKRFAPRNDYQNVKGTYLSDVFEKNQAEKLMQAVHESLATKEITIVSYQNEINGAIRHFEARISPMTTNKVLSVVRDTTNIIDLETELVYNNSLLRMITQLATPFINLPVNQIEVEINHMLSKIGTFAGVDRVYIFDYDWINNTQTNTFEWCSENTSSEIHNLQNIPNEVLPEWVAAHKSGDMTSVPSVSSMDENDFLKQILEPQGIKSLITIPLIEESVCLGYVGFDVVVNERNFSDSEISLLRIFAELLTNLKIKQRTENLLIQNRNILENQNEQLQNLNNKLKLQNDEILLKNQELDIQRERVLASDKLKTAFLNNVSHEVRTPLNGIIGFAQFLDDNMLSEEDKKELIVALNESVNRLTDTINDIMDASLLMSGNMTIYPEEVDLNKLLEETFSKFEQEAIAKNLVLSVKKPKQNQSPNLISDIGMLRKILSELVGNAIKYTKKGFIAFGGKIDENQLVLTVEDTGIGISNEALPKIFEPFMQEDFSTTRKYEGSGLGLTVVNGFVDMLNGTIDVRSKPNEGTMFTVILPLIQQTKAEPLKEPKNETIEKNVVSILIAEDDAMNILYIKRMLKSTTLNSYFAINGIEAVEAIRLHPNIGLVLMDIKMPEMDGLEATKIIKSLKPSLPIIAVTAFASNEDRHQCMLAGCDDYISKPFKAEILSNLIEKYVKTA